jgi:hypothetical protein
VTVFENVGATSVGTELSSSVSIFDACRVVWFRRLANTSRMKFMRVGYKFYECSQCNDIQCYRMNNLFIVIFVCCSCFIAELPNSWNVPSCIHERIQAHLWSTVSCTKYKR